MKFLSPKWTKLDQPTHLHSGSSVEHKIGQKCVTFEVQIALNFNLHQVGANDAILLLQFLIQFTNDIVYQFRI